MKPVNSLRLRSDASVEIFEEIEIMGIEIAKIRNDRNLNSLI